MYSEKFLKFIEMWQKDFAIERTIDEKICVDKDGNPVKAEKDIQDIKEQIAKSTKE